MTNILAQLDSDDDATRVEHLEAELGSMRKAFEEYISTTQDLEVDVNKELHQMRK